MHVSILRPSRYSGICGPGTLVTMRLNRRVEKLSREATASSVGGAKRSSDAITAAPTACFERLRWAIASATMRSRSTGSQA